MLKSPTRVNQAWRTTGACWTQSSTQKHGPMFSRPELGPRSAARQQDVAGGGLDPEIDVRAAEQLDVDECAAAEIRARIVDAEMSGAIGEAEAERIVLKPVAIEGEDLDAFHRILAVADGDAAADHPGVEQGADEAPEAGRQAVVPAGQQTSSRGRHCGCSVVTENCTGP